MPPYKAKAIANYFLDLAEADGKRLDPMQLQKLVYFAHGWYLALTGEPLVEEHPEAWTYGPVFPSLYHEFKRYGPGHIESRAMEWHLDMNAGSGQMMDFHPVPPTLDDDPGRNSTRIREAGGSSCLGYLRLVDCAPTVQNHAPAWRPLGRNAPGESGSQRH